VSWTIKLSSFDGNIGNSSLIKKYRHPRGGGTRGYQWRGGANDAKLFNPKKVHYAKTRPQKSPTAQNRNPPKVYHFYQPPKKVLAKIFISKKVNQKIDNPQKVPSCKFQMQKRSLHLPAWCMGLVSNHSSCLSSLLANSWRTI